MFAGGRILRARTHRNVTLRRLNGRVTCLFRPELDDSAGRFDPIGAYCKKSIDCLARIFVFFPGAWCEDIVIDGGTLGYWRRIHLSNLL